MANFTGQKVKDTFQRVVQVDSGQLQDGLGNNLPISISNNDVHISGAIRAESYIVSESVISVTSGSTVFGNSSDDTHRFIGSVKTKLDGGTF